LNKKQQNVEGTPNREGERGYQAFDLVLRKGERRGKERRKGF